MSNPFRIGTTSHHDFNIMSDLKWHCTKCELKSGQAKTWQMWRHQGIQIDTDDKGNLFKTIFCKSARLSACKGSGWWLGKLPSNSKLSFVSFTGIFLKSSFKNKTPIAFAGSAAILNFQLPHWISQ